MSSVLHLYPEARALLTPPDASWAHLFRMLHAKVVKHSKAWLTKTGEAGRVFALVELYDGRFAVVVYAVGASLRDSRLEVLDQWPHIPGSMRLKLFERTFRARGKLNITRTPGRPATQREDLLDVELAPTECDIRKLEALLLPADGPVAHLAWTPGASTSKHRSELDSAMREAISWFASKGGFLEPHMYEVGVLADALEAWRTPEDSELSGLAVSALASVLSVWGQLYSDGPLELLRELSSTSSPTAHFLSWQRLDSASIQEIQRHLDWCMRRKEVHRNPAGSPLRLPVRVWLQEVFSPAVPALTRALERSLAAGA